RDEGVGMSIGLRSVGRADIQHRASARAVSRSGSSRVALRATRSTVLVLIFWVFAPLAQAFDLAQLNSQLRQQPVVRGSFIQEKHLRALPQPLVSRGRFVLAQEFGLLWLLQTPLQQD